MKMGFRVVVSRDEKQQRFILLYVSKLSDEGQKNENNEIKAEWVYNGMGVRIKLFGKYDEYVDREKVKEGYAPCGFIGESKQDDFLKLIKSSTFERMDKNQFKDIEENFEGEIYKKEFIV